MFGGRRKADIDDILIVEDEALVAFDNEHVLTDAGYHVVATVDNAAGAAAILAEKTVGLVVADLTLRGDGGGCDVAAEAWARGVPTLFVSGSGEAPSTPGAIALLEKPYSDKDLLAAIEAVASVVAGRAPKKAPDRLRVFPLADKGVAG